MLWGFTDGNPDDTIEAIDPEVSMVVDTLPGGMDRYWLIDSHDEARESETRFIGVNFKWLSNVKQREQYFAPPDAYRVVTRASHPASLPAVAYEAYKPWVRRRLAARDYQIVLYERQPSPQATFTANR